MLEDHRSGPRHDGLMSAYRDDDSSGWMVSYIDIMTLLVALFVVIVTASGAAHSTSLSEEAASIDSPAGLAPYAISAALGVAGRPRLAPVEAPVNKLRAPVTLESDVVSPPRLLALPERTEQPAPPRLAVAARPLPTILLPTELTDTDVATPAESLALAPSLLATLPLADYLVLLTDRPPVNVEPVAFEALDEAALEAAAALANAQVGSWEQSLYLPNLDGVEVSRVAEGISLRVQDRLLFPSAEAELTQMGDELVASLLETIQRFEGDVWVEGHSDSQAINTPRFSSNWALSSARAIAIVEALVRAGVDPARLRAVGLADTRPLEANDTPEGRARNRRVEVVIHVE